MDSPQEDVTVLLAELAEGRQEAAEKLIPLVYEELKRLARSYMRRERPDHTLQTTALVHEAYLKLVRQQDVHWEGRSHFFGIAAQLMRRVLVDHARGHCREKRGAGQNPTSLEDVVVFSPERSSELLSLDESLRRLTKLDPRQGRIVELRFFGGLTVEETAHVMGLSPKTIKREWSMAKAWLHGDLRQSHGNPTRELGES